VPVLVLERFLQHKAGELRKHALEWNPLLTAFGEAKCDFGMFNLREVIADIIDPS